MCSSDLPELLSYLDPIVEGKEWMGMRSRGNFFQQNLIVGGPDNPVNLLGGNYATIESSGNWVTQKDPGFVDLKNGNLNLKPNAQVFSKIKGFQPIPFDKIGIEK